MTASPAPAVARSSPPPVQAVPTRHWGRWVSAVVLAVLLALFVVAIAGNKTFDFKAVPTYLHDPSILTGVRHTLLLTVIAQAIGVLLGIGLAVLRLSKNPVLSGVSWFYIWFFRGTPVFVQLIFWFNIGLVFPTVALGIPGTSVEFFSTPTNSLVTAFTAALLGLGLNEGAYMAEIVRGGLLAVDPGQTEAAHALGMSSGLTMRRVVLPQALRVIIPPTGNEFINMLKTSSLVSVITYDELLTKAQNIYSSNLKTLELLVVASLWYLVLTSIFSVGQYFVERRFARGTAQATAATPFQRLRGTFLGAPRP